MPGTRNLARELAQHDHAETQRRTYELLRSQLPEKDTALVGWPAILAHLASLGVSRPNGRPVSRRMVNRWRAHLALPMLRGNHRHHHRSPPFTTAYALTAWLLAHLDTDRCFRIDALPTAAATLPHVSMLISQAA